MVVVLVLVVVAEVMRGVEEVMELEEGSAATA